MKVLTVRRETKGLAVMEVLNNVASTHDLTRERERACVATWTVQKVIAFCRRRCRARSSDGKGYRYLLGRMYRWLKRSLAPGITGGAGGGAETVDSRSDTPPFDEPEVHGMFMMTLRSAKKGFAGRCFVKKSARLSWVRTKGTRMAWSSTTSRTKKWRRAMCLVRSWCSGL